ncbi:hypothetical protein ABTH65_19205, partial [Acinetobacter baumannii]
MDALTKSHLPCRSRNCRRAELKSLLSFEVARSNGAYETSVLWDGESQMPAFERIPLDQRLRDL